MTIEAALFAHCSLRTFIKGNEEMTRHFTRADAEAIGLFKSNKTIALRTLRKYTRVTHAQILKGTYNEYRQYIESVPSVSRNSIEAIVAELAPSDLGARQAKVDDFIDMRFVAEMEQDGFFKKLASK